MVQGGPFAQSSGKYLSGKEFCLCQFSYFPFLLGSSKNIEGSPGDSAVENLPANAGDTGSMPSLGGLRVPWDS